MEEEEFAVDFEATRRSLRLIEKSEIISPSRIFISSKSRNLAIHHDDIC
jgi:predicted transcriptional regulator